MLKILFTKGDFSMKRKIVTVLLATVLSTSLCACGISQEDYDKAVSAKEAAEQELATTKDSLDQLQSDYDSLQSDYDSYKEKMKPYEEMETAEAEARKVAAEQEKAAAEEAEAQKKAEEEAAAQKAAEEEAKKQAEKEKKGYDTGITYDNLARNPDDYKGEKVKFKGKVVQVIEGDSENQIRLAVNSDYDTILYCGYDPSIVSSRVLEDDIITVYGYSVGTISYQSTLGGNITIPGVYVEKIDQ